MSHLLELLGKGLGTGLDETLGRFYWSAGLVPVADLQAQAAAHPDYPDVQCQLGLACLRANRLDEAVAHLGEACRQKPDYLPARLALASAIEEAGDFSRALDHLKIANQVRVGHPAILFAMGYLLEKLGRPDQAVEHYRDAVTADGGKMIPARQRLAALALYQDRVAEAVAQYEHLAQADPGDSNARITLAQLYHRGGDYGKAVQEYETAIAMEPENWALVDDEVEALVADGQLREAVERLEELLSAQGDFPDLHLRIADLYSQCGDDAGAMLHYGKALQGQPEYLEARVKVGTHHLLQGRWAEASEAFAEATELNDRLLTAYVGLGVAQAAAGDRTAAVSSFELAGAVEPNSTLLVREMARLQLKAALEAHAQQADQSPEELPDDSGGLGSDDLLKLQIERHARCVQAHGDHADLRYRYGVLLRSEGRLVEAVEQFDRAVQINPAYTQALIKKGVTLQDLGQTAQAIETFESALRLKPKYVDLHYRLGLLYTDGKRFEEAVRHIEQAQEVAKDSQTIRAGLALALQNMGLMDRAAAAWRSLSHMTNPPTGVAPAPKK